MAPKRIRAPWRAVVVRVVLGLACGAVEGCATVDQPNTFQPSFRPTDMELDEGLRNLRAQVPPEDGAVIDELMWSDYLVLHLSQKDLPLESSRGGASSLASTRFSRERCQHHPIDGVPSKRNWDLFYDRQVAEWWAKRLNVPHPIEVILYHEIFGHIVRLLRHPEFLELLDKDEELRKSFEDEARIIENHYRKYLGLPEVPPYLPEPSSL